MRSYPLRGTRPRVCSAGGRSPVSGTFEERLRGRGSPDLSTAVNSLRAIRAVVQTNDTPGSSETRTRRVRLLPRARAFHIAISSLSVVSDLKSVKLCKLMIYQLTRDVFRPSLNFLQLGRRGKGRNCSHFSCRDFCLAVVCSTAYRIYFFNFRISCLKNT